MKWNELKEGDVVHNTTQGTSFLLVDIMEDMRLYLDLSDGCILRAKSIPDTAIERPWRVEGVE